MKTLLFSLAAAIAWAAAGPLPKPERAREFPDLTSGRYEIKLTGLLCSLCSRAIVVELVKIPEVESAKTDFDREAVIVSVKNERKLKIRALRRAFAKAARRANMGGSYDVASIRYIP